MKRNNHGFIDFFVRVYLPTYLPTYIPNYIPTYLPTYLKVQEAQLANPLLLTTEMSISIPNGIHPIFDHFSAQLNCIQCDQIGRFIGLWATF